jgi:hypothetical protein
MQYIDTPTTSKNRKERPASFPLIGDGSPIFFGSPDDNRGSTSAELSEGAQTWEPYDAEAAAAVEAERKQARRNASKKGQVILAPEHGRQKKQ